jgi:hypothetical protein
MSVRTPFTSRPPSDIRGAARQERMAAEADRDAADAE